MLGQGGKRAGSRSLLFWWHDEKASRSMMFSRHQRGGSRGKTKRLFWGRRSLHSVYLVPVSCSYTGATSIVFVKWLRLIRIQITATSKLQGSFFYSCFLLHAAEESKQLRIANMESKLSFKFSSRVEKVGEEQALVTMHLRWVLYQQRKAAILLLFIPSAPAVDLQLVLTESIGGAAQATGTR